jgi:alpha-glucosidase
MLTKGLVLLGSAIPALAHSLESRQSRSLDGCPGYTASNVQSVGSTVTADLSLAGTACNVYGNDLTNLKLFVEYQTGKYSTRSHSMIHRIDSP